jgi:holo-[acyl-carrier protein] synthase
VLQGLGIDLIEVARVKKLVESDGRFAERVFSAAEIAYCESKHNRAQHYAARFAAKEAFFKALGTGWRDGMGWTEVAVGNDGLGKPEIVLSGRAAEVFANRGLHAIHLSISHTREHAVSVVVLE